MKRQTYRRLNRINEGFEEVLDTLRSLRKHPSLRRSEVSRYEPLTVEPRASTNSYLLEAFAPVETVEAGQLFKKRLQRERREERE
jgi:hypothetical protein